MRLVMKNWLFETRLPRLLLWGSNAFAMWSGVQKFPTCQALLDFSPPMFKLFMEFFVLTKGD